MPPPDLTVAVLEVFRPEFSRPGWDKIMVLVLGTPSTGTAGPADASRGACSAAWSGPPPERIPGTIGRPRKAGDRQPNLEERLADATTAWEEVALRWYDGFMRPLRIATGTALWYHSGLAPLPIRWFLTCDSLGQLEPRAYFTTYLDGAAARVVAEFPNRWTPGSVISWRPSRGSRSAWRPGVSRLLVIRTFECEPTCVKIPRTRLDRLPNATYYAH